MHAAPPSQATQPMHIVEQCDIIKKIILIEYKAVLSAMNENSISNQAEPLPLSPAPVTKHHRLKLSRRARRQLAIEFVLGLIGLYGIGFLLSRNIRAGIGALAFSAVWFVIRIALLLATAGFLLIVLFPLTILFALSHTVTLRRTIRASLR
jgi:hypothetical protein